ncbi:MAG: NAD(+) synthase [Hydrogenoanaerobacterium sp.]
MNSLIRVSCVSNRVAVLNPQKSLANIIAALEELRESAPDIVLLPSLALTSCECGNLFCNSALLDGARIALEELCIASSDMEGYIVVGLAVDDWGKPAPVCAVLLHGQVLGYVPSQSGLGLNFDGNYSDKILPCDTVFGMGKCRFTVCSAPPQELPLKAGELLATGCDLVLCPCAQPVYAGYTEEAQSSIQVLSRALGCAVAVCNGGTGESSHPRFYNGFAGIYECGDEMCFVKHENTDYKNFADIVTADIDLDIIAAQKKGGVYTAPFACAEEAQGKKGILRKIKQNPFLTDKNCDAYIAEVFSMQVSSLMSRLKNVGFTRIVVGVSGGLDSTLVLLVAAKAMQCLELPSQNIYGITMPGFGTTGRTYQNALSLMDAIGCTKTEISIKEACLVHFKDIGQDENCHDITYENAQARERTQVLFDASNKLGALVLGTGDLSEEALGWCTFGGDQLAGYNINVCLTKNMVRAVTEYVASGGAELCAEGEIKEILCDILATPVSPELLPTENGETTQKTEEILGKYDLHDFFAYYFIKYGFRPTKLYRYACIAFGTKITPEEVKDKLKMFIKRFFASQFKRSCAPDAAAITEVNLLGTRFSMPSDADCSALLDELESAE